MSYRLLLHKNVSKFIESRHVKQRQEITKNLELLKENPFPNTELDIKTMQGYENLYRLRLGSYRFIYKIDQGALIVFIFKAGNRGDVYRIVNRKTAHQKSHLYFKFIILRDTLCLNNSLPSV